jgi:hypothetical protein
LKRSSIALLAIALTGALLLAAPASADQKSGCPASPVEVWEELTVETIAATIWPLLLDQSPYTGQQDFQESILRPYDKNGDGLLCMKTTSGDEYNPKSHWAGTWYFIYRDNNSNGSNN